MRYWVYINNKVDGPYDENNLVTLQGFTPDTLICSEEVASNGGQEWVKASAVFEFDEVPVNEPAPQPVVEPAPAPQAEQPDNKTQALLTRLEELTKGMSNLQSKLDSMQHHLDDALEQNKKLSDQVARLSHPVPADTPIPAHDEPHSNTITLTRRDMSSLEKEETAKEESPLPEQAAPEEEEVIIRSALDSIYGGKPVQIEDTFQDLLPEKTAAQEARKKAEEEQAVHNIEPDLEFIPVQEDTKTQPTMPPQQADPAPAVQAHPVEQEEAQPLPAEALDEIEKEMTFMSLQENKEVEGTPAEEPSLEQPTPQTETVEELKEAVITTPSLEETAKDALINELTASPKEDILDQIIAQHQQEPTPAQEEKSQAGEIALGAAAAGLATASLVSLVDKEQTESAPMAIATDKDNPEKLEEVLPVEQMPEDAPVPQPEPEPVMADLPSLEQTPEVTPPTAEESNITPEIPVADIPQELPQMQEENPVATDLPGLDEQAAIEQQATQETVAEEQPAQEELQELVPGAKLKEEAEGFYIKGEETPAQEEEPVQAEPALQEQETPAQEEEPVQAEPALQEQETSAQEEEPVQAEPALQEQETPSQEEEPVHETGAITDKDLQDAFGGDDSQPVAASAMVDVLNEPLPEGNPNELTEIELKEGSTYLISDFVPPAQLTDNVADVMKGAEQSEDKKDKDVAFQDMLAAVTKAQFTKSLDTNGLPDDLSATQINLENTIHAKRGASLDIKTVPMVSEPSETNRLNVDELNDVNTQHDMKTAKGVSKSTKTVMMIMVGLLLLIILYVLLGFMKLLPASVNLFAGKQQAASTQNVQELLPETQPQAPVQEIPQGPTPVEQAQTKVQNFPLPNGLTLKAFIESKHAGISPELITWETADAVEADNYSVTVKVPPENPQNFKTVYRFNYNAVTGLLDPTVSEAKNLLDQAYGIKPAAQTVTATAPKATTTKAPAKQTATRGTVRKSTSRKRTN